MATIELKLNPSKVGNYAFFCPVTRLHLTLANPVGIANRVSPYIIKAIKSKTLIDVNGVIDINTGKENVTKADTPVNPKTAVIQQKQEEKSEEMTIEDTKKPKRGKRVQVNPVDEVVK